MKQLYFLILTGLLFSCKKVDEHAAMVADQPWLADELIEFEGSKLAPLSWSYPTTLLVDDTAMLIGKLFPYDPGTVIKIGGVPIRIIDTVLVKNVIRGGLDKIDGVRFIVTKEMGIGNNRTVSITAHGITIHGPSVKIQLVEGGQHRTDTTLWVDELAQWMPENMDPYLQHQYALVRSIHTDKSGVIYFDNQLTVQKVENGQVSKIIHTDDALQDDKGDHFTIRQVLGSAITFNGDALYFSAEVNEESPDATDNYIFRLCKLNFPSKTIQTLNRTTVAKGSTPTDENGSPFQGNIDQLKVVAMNMNLNVNDNLIYTNYYAPGTKQGDHSSWYAGIVSGIIGAEPYMGSLMLICRLDVDGKVYGLMSNNGNYKSMGFPVITGYYLPDPSGKYIYGLTSLNYVQFDLLQYDLTEDEISARIKTVQDKYTFRSYEKDPAFQRQSALNFYLDPYGYQLNRVMQLNNGNTLALLGASIANYHLADKTMYCYAGTEIAIGSNIPEQDKHTGPAKWVDYSSASLIGQDKNGSIYYCTGATDLSEGVKFYKLYPKK